MNLLVHSWATSSQANSLLRGTTAILAPKLTSLSIFGLRVRKRTRFCVEPPPSLAVLKHPFRKPFENSLLSSCTSLYNCSTSSFSSEKLASAWNYRRPRPKMYIRVHFWAASLQANLLLRGTTDIPVRPEIPFAVSLLKIACPEVYIRVHFRTRVFAAQKHRY